MDEITKWLFTKPNVVLVGKGHKIVRGEDTGRDAIVVGVIKKLPLHALKIEDVIPAKVDDKETDVIEAGVIRALQARTDEWNPAPGGVSIGHKDVSAGTHGIMVWKTSVRYILSNNHGLANENKAVIGDSIFQPGKLDGGVKERAKLAEFIPLIGFEGEEPEPPPPPSDCPVANFIVDICNWIALIAGRETRLQAIVPKETREGINKVDVALARPLDDAEFLDSILEIGEPKGRTEGEVGMKIKGSGRTSALVHDEIAAIDGTANVMYNSGQIFLEDQLITKGPMLLGGDSGMIILTEDNRVVGGGFAGSDKLSILNKYSNIKEALQLDG